MKSFLILALVFFSTLVMARDIKFVSHKGDKFLQITEQDGTVYMVRAESFNTNNCTLRDVEGRFSEFPPDMGQWNDDDNGAFSCQVERWYSRTERWTCRMVMRVHGRFATWFRVPCPGHKLAEGEVELTVP